MLTKSRNRIANCTKTKYYRNGKTQNVTDYKILCDKM
jgi:hypothetical protein